VRIKASSTRLGISGCRDPWSITSPRTSCRARTHATRRRYPTHAQESHIPFLCPWEWDHSGAHVSLYTPPPRAGMTVSVGSLAPSLCLSISLSLSLSLCVCVSARTTVSVSVLCIIFCTSTMNRSRRSPGRWMVSTPSTTASVSVSASSRGSYCRHTPSPCQAAMCMRAAHPRAR
jgi:hypothetical protein